MPSLWGCSLEWLTVTTSQTLQGKILVSESIETAQMGNPEFFQPHRRNIMPLVDYKTQCNTRNSKCPVCKAWLVKGKIKTVDGVQICRSHPTPK